MLVRDGNRLDINVCGPTAERGSMRRVNPGAPAESEFASMTFNLPSSEDGRSRKELVLQMQDEGVPSDLGWDDLKVLASGLVGGPAATRSASAALPEGVHLQRSLETVSLRTRRGQTLRLDRLVQQDTPGNPALQPGKGGGLAGGGAVIMPPPLFTEPAVWTHAAQLPRLPSGRALRVVLREFERFHTDRTVPEPVSSGNPRRRVVGEERLVHTEVFALD